MMHNLIKIDGSWIENLIASLTLNHPELNNSGFVQVANVGKLNCDGYRLSDGMEIRRARPNEINSLQRLIDVTCPGSPLSSVRNPYETALREVVSLAVPRSTTFDVTDLPEQDWRYHVIA